MAAYAALNSLLQNLGTLFYPLPRIFHNRAQLLSLHEQVIFLLNFLDNSFAHNTSQISALEAKMREAAYKAEDLIEYGILDSESRDSSNTWKVSFCFILYAFVVVSISERVFVSSAEVIPLWIQFFLAEVVMCTINAVALYLFIKANYVFLALNDPQELRRVLYDFNVIVKDVVQIKEARGDPDMPAHAVLISLRQILDSVLDSGHDRSHLESLHEKVSFLLEFIGNASSYMTAQKSELQNMDATITNAAHKAKRALIEFQLPGKFSLNFYWSTLTNVSFRDPLLFIPAFFIVTFRLPDYRLTYWGFPQEIPVCFDILLQLFIIFASYMVSAVVALVVIVAQCNSENQELPQVVDDFSIIVRKIEDVCGKPSELPAAAASSRQDLGGTSRNVVVGLDRDLEEIRDRLVRDSNERELTSIVGMGGIGKTTLARQVYYDPGIYHHFDIRAWVTVSQEYSLRHVLLCLLDSAEMLTQEMQEDNDDKLALHLHKILMNRRYLVIMDDVWDTRIWDFMSRYFPENCNGSRVLLTSRLSNVASYPDSSSPLHQMQCLNDNDSWYLLHDKVFGAEGCPLELESIGREIARSCRGLPLAIVVIGGLLSKDNRIKIWRDLAEKLKNSEMRQIKEQCLEILGLSYNHLPHHLRPCFLYMGVFPRDSQISVSRLISLWVAEGFLKPCTTFKTLEEVAQDYLNDLIDRNLISVCKRSCNGKMRTCSIHDLLRDVCVQNACRENFLHVVDSGGSVITRERRDETLRRLSIHPDALQVNARHDLKSCCNYVRSFLCIGSKPIKDSSVVYLGFMCLRVLDVLVVHFGKFPHQIIKLRRLRYLAFHSDGPLPPSISNLQNLQTLVHHHSSFCKHLFLPPVIWTMPNLRHIYMKPGCYLFNPLGYQLPSKRFILGHLQTLAGIRNFKWSKGIIKRIPNLKKLGISYHVSSSVDWSTYQLETLVNLHQLKTLKIIIKYDDVGSAISHDPPKLAFPKKLKKLSLSGCGIPWASMTTIGALPSLEALKLRCEAFSGHSWETVEGQFPQLIFLLLEEISFESWETEAAHFPLLQRLVIMSCGMLEEIPCAIADIPTLEMIHLVDCHPSAVASAINIQEEQEREGNEVLKFHIERRRVREVDEMNLGNLDARGLFARGLQVLTDVVRSAGEEIMFLVVALAVGMNFLFGKNTENPAAFS